MTPSKVKKKSSVSMQWKLTFKNRVTTDLENLDFENYPPDPPWTHNRA